MLYILSGQSAEMTWRICRGTSDVSEDWSRVNPKVLLIRNHGENRIPITYAINDEGNLVVHIPETLPIGVYGIVAMWQKTNKPLVKSEKDNVFTVISEASGATMPNATVVNFSLKTYVATYGYDGLSAYEMAVMKGLTVELSENDWIKSQTDAVAGLLDELRLAKMALEKRVTRLEARVTTLESD